jgi:hypothetical protein
MPRIIDIVANEAWDAEIARQAEAWRVEKARRPMPDDAEMELRARIWEDEKARRAARRWSQVEDWTADWRAEKALRTQAWRDETARRMDVWKIRADVGPVEVARWKEAWDTEKAKRAEFSRARKARLAAKAEAEKAEKGHSGLPRRFAHVLATIAGDKEVVLGHLASLSAIKGPINKITASAALGVTQEEAAKVLEELHGKHLLTKVQDTRIMDYYKLLRKTAESARKADAAPDTFSALDGVAEARISVAAEARIEAAKAKRRVKRAALPRIVRQ